MKEKTIEAVVKPGRDAGRVPLPDSREVLQITSIILGALGFFASAAFGAMPPQVKTGPDRNATQLQVALKKIGCLRPKSVKEVGPSNFTVDGAPVDRDFVDFDKYRD